MRPDKNLRSFVMRDEKPVEVTAIVSTQHAQIEDTTVIKQDDRPRCTCCGEVVLLGITQTCQPNGRLLLVVTQAGLPVILLIPMAGGLLLRKGLHR